MGDQGRPFHVDADERRLWDEALQEETTLDRVGKPYGDPALEAYLSGLAARLMSPAARAAGAPALTVSVLRDPTLCAFAMPNGRIYVHTGLLARVADEAQLAMVLGREVVHVTHRHALAATRHAGSQGVGPAAALEESWVTTETLRVTARVLLDPRLPLARAAAVNGFGRALEGEADTLGMEHMVQAGYDPREAPEVFEVFKKVHGDPPGLEGCFLGNPRRLDERIGTTRALLRARYAALPAERPVRGTEEFERRLGPVRRDNALLDVQAGRFKQAQAQLDRVLALTPGDPVAHLHAGDLHRIEAQRATRPEDRAASLDRARRAYERAAALDPASADPYHRLGLLHYQERDTAGARAAFTRYLAIAPDAPDARRIKEYLLELSPR